MVFFFNERYYILNIAEANLSFVVVNLLSFLLQALLYLIRVMDHVVENEYVVVYFHTQVTGRNQPPMAYLKMVYNYLDVR